MQPQHIGVGVIAVPVVPKGKQYILIGKKTRQSGYYNLLNVSKLEIKLETTIFVFFANLHLKKSTTTHCLT